MANSTILNGTYDIQGFLDTDPITNSGGWLIKLNGLLGNYLVPSILLVVGIVLFFGVKRLDGVSDAQAGTFAGLICSVVGLFLVLIKVDGVQVMTLTQWTPFFIVMLVFLAFLKMNKNY